MKNEFCSIILFLLFLQTLLYHLVGTGYLTPFRHGKYNESVNTNLVVSLFNEQPDGQQNTK